MPTISVAEAKSHLSEIINKSAYNNEKFIITRRKKPVAALVSLDGLRIIEQHEERKGLAAISGKWRCFTEVVMSLGDIESLRNDAGTGRDVSF